MDLSLATPAYSEALVSLARTLDAAEAAVFATNWCFDEIDRDCNGLDVDLARWARGHLDSLDQTMAGLRAAFVQLLRQENPGWQIEASANGSAKAPREVQALFDAIMDGEIHGVPGDTQPSRLQVLPAWAQRLCEERRAIVFDDSLYPVPKHLTDSFVEVWFRRCLGWHNDGSAYEAYLVKRDYGWQAYGCER